MSTSAKKATPPDVDVAIIGGGMTGATLALALDTFSNGQLRIALVEADNISHKSGQLTPLSGFDARCIALSYGSCQALDALGLWQYLATIATPIRHIHVSDKGHSGLTHLDAMNNHLPYLGQVIALEQAGDILYQRIAQTSAIRLISPASVTAIERTQDDAALLLSTSERLNAKLIVAADGGLSTSAGMLGINQQQHDFHQTAIIANIQTKLNNQGRAFERFTPTGPLALLPMGEQLNSLVWCTTSEAAGSLMQLSDTQFIRALQQQFGWRLGEITAVSRRHCYPLILRQSEKLVSHRAALVGNAAQTLHPIAGQGFNLAMRDVMNLARCIAAAQQAKQDIGGMALLQAYRETREQDRDDTIGLISTLVTGFSTPSLAIATVRNLGLLTMTACPALKTPLLRHMLGLHTTR